ncbi:hypothetical protein [Akkermansia glycaniphila]|uniref:Biopolymer transport protein exbd/tolr n=1 Tax=Akkermansia glycaniphila TaxID=1679444 RepID=A0A1C7PC15_9BACT|nr:hypothetical protein [Akkermansia glycaniphila]MBT9450140.1 hypothetical protein [Akkermansia glycaniphila]OCA03120.1 hypothetical protein AC781_06225 [Akkermansia glycaniphila]SEH96632.1 Hypothetical protein PYTT_2150 [Akkermansia glycaniphila]
MPTLPQVRSTLPDITFMVLGCVVLNVVILVVTVTLMSSGIIPRYGVTIQPASSQFMMEVQNQTYTLTIVPGDEPRYFLDNRQIESGFDGIGPALDKIIRNTKKDDLNRVTIVVFADKSIPSGVEQKVIDLILLKDLNCTKAAEPAL